MVIEVAARAETTSLKEVGASGFVSMTAPFPTKDVKELPYSLYAITTADILEPQTILNGVAIKVVIGMLQYVYDIICA
jgi:hypothetical protein